MRLIFADVCVHRDLVETLRVAGFDVWKAADKGFDRASDNEIYEYAQKHGRVLLTHDKDFGNIVQFDIRRSKGVVIVYVEGMDKSEILDKTVDFFEKNKNRSLDGHLFLIENDGERTWPRPP